MHEHIKGQGYGAFAIVDGAGFTGNGEAVGMVGLLITLGPDDIVDLFFVISNVELLSCQLFFVLIEP